MIYHILVSSLFFPRLDLSCALVLLLVAGVRFTLGKAVGYEEAPSGLALSGGCGPVSTGLEGGMGLSFMREMASGSSSSVIDVPFPFVGLQFIGWLSCWCYKFCFDECHPLQKGLLSS